MKIFIDCTESKKAVVTLIDGKRKVTKEGTEVLPLIEEILRENSLKPTDVEFDSHQGPGSFTGVRVGAAIANALSFALGRDKTIIPHYD